MTRTRKWWWVLLVGLLAIAAPSIGMATSSIDAQFQTLVEQSNEQLAQGNLGEAVKRLKAAADLKPSPAILLRTVSILSDLAVKEGTPGARCDDTRAAMEAFFRACTECAEPKEKACRVCRFVDKSSTQRPLVDQTAALAEHFEQLSQEMSEELASSEGEAAIKALRKRDGFAGRARDVNRCLGGLNITSTPPGATVRINGQTMGLTPQVITVFAGRLTITVEMSGSPLQDRKVTVEGGDEKALHFDLVAPGPVAAVVSTRPSPRRPWILPMITAGFGLIAAGSGAALMTDAAADSRRARDQDPADISHEDYQDADKRYSHGIVLTSVGSAIIIGGLSWWFLGSEPVPELENQTITVGISPGMIHVGGSL